MLINSWMVYNRSSFLLSLLHSCTFSSSGDAKCRLIEIITKIALHFSWCLFSVMVKTPSGLCPRPYVALNVVWIEVKCRIGRIYFRNLLFESTNQNNAVRPGVTTTCQGSTKFIGNILMDMMKQSTKFHFS